MPFLGTIVNCLTVLGGSLLGILLSRVFSKYHRLASVPDAAMKAISVFVIFIGAKGAMSSDKELVILLSLVIGTVIGTIINIDSLLERFGSFMERKFVRAKPQLTGHEELDGPRQQKSISKGFISTTLTCCVGALSIMGALNSGLEGDHSGSNGVCLAVVQRTDLSAAVGLHGIDEFLALLGLVFSELLEVVLDDGLFLLEGNTNRTVVEVGSEDILADGHVVLDRSKHFHLGCFGVFLVMIIRLVRLVRQS